MINLENIFSSKYYNIIIVLFLVITFTITLYNLLKPKYESYTIVGHPAYFSTVKLSELDNVKLSELDNVTFDLITTLSSNTTSIEIDIDLASMSNASSGPLEIIDNDTKRHVPNDNTTKFALNLITYGSNSKDITTFKPIHSYQIITSVNELTNITNKNYNFRINNFNFKYFYIAVDLHNLDKSKNFKIDVLRPNIQLTTVTLKK